MVDSKEKDMILAAKFGSKDAFGELVDTYYKLVLAAALTYVDTRVEAEDLSQEAFIKAYKYLPKLRKTQSFVPWLMRITRQLCIDHIRKSKRQVSCVSIEKTHLQNVGGCEDFHLSSEQRAFIRKRISLLPEKMKNVVLMRFVMGLNSTEIAEKLNKKPPAVRVMLHRAYCRLKTDLSQIYEEVSI